MGTMEKIAQRAAELQRGGVAPDLALGQAIQEARGERNRTHPGVARLAELERAGVPHEVAYEQVRLELGV